MAYKVTRVLGKSIEDLPFPGGKLVRAQARRRGTFRDQKTAFLLAYSELLRAVRVRAAAVRRARSAAHESSLARVPARSTLPAVALGLTQRAWNQPKAAAARYVIRDVL